MGFDTAARPATRRNISDILCAVGKPPFFLILAALCLLLASYGASHAAQQAPEPLAPSPAQTSPAPTPPAAPPAPAQSPPQPAGPVIVLDPAHGGTDTGARGENAVEKDVVLQLARSVHGVLERQGYRVVVTRNDDSNPSYDDRAAMANAYRESIFVSLHASSTGSPGTVRAYYMQFAAPIPPAAAGGGPAGAAPAKLAPAIALARWEDAQRPYIAASHRLADLMQGEFAQSFQGSPPYSAGVPVRALRSVTAPAVAVEISSVSGETPDLLAASGEPLGAAIARAIAIFRQSGMGGAK
jgi:N-acetylmuramoyl-L-alanine amidase